VLLPSKVLPGALPRWLTLHRTESSTRKKTGAGGGMWWVDLGWLSNVHPATLSFASSAGQGDKTR